ncbi:helix-turn-helix transcriptional regulator [Planctomonas deserti]|uniref:helix-turn-helix transcriptional regulator n=1 Tax=Planctomonas deserti TaxID=2144185 RepID=UPI000D338769|nr:helix-turn-helix domain-containing protein [Planctomonas deserti]
MNAHKDLESVPAVVPADALGLPPLIDVAELAKYLGVPVSTIYDWRTHGKGPTAYRFGKHLKFAVSDVRDWVAGQREPA